MHSNVLCYAQVVVLNPAGGNVTISITPDKPDHVVVYGEHSSGSEYRDFPVPVAIFGGKLSLVIPSIAFKKGVTRNNN